MYLNNCAKHSKFTLTGFYENFSNLCNEKQKSTLVEIRQISDPTQTMYVMLYSIESTSTCLSLEEEFYLLNIIS